MRSFKDFVSEEIGTMSGPAVAGTGEDKTTVPVRRKPPVVSGPKPPGTTNEDYRQDSLKAHLNILQTLPSVLHAGKGKKPPTHDELINAAVNHSRRNAQLAPKAIGEDTKKDQASRLKVQKSETPPVKNQTGGYDFELKDVGKIAESNLPRDAEGKEVTPEREEHGGFWSSHRHPKGELEWFPRKQVIKSGDKTWTRTIPDTPTPKPKVDKGRTTRGRASEVLGAQQKAAAERKAKELEQKQEQKEIAKRIRELKLKREKEKLEKQQPSLYDKIKGK